MKHKTASKKNIVTAKPKVCSHTGNIHASKACQNAHFNNRKCRVYNSKECDQKGCGGIHETQQDVQVQIFEKMQ